MKIQLDTKALQTLFPEGSEARIDLQRAVVANMLRKSFRGDLSLALRDEITRTVSEMRTEMRQLIQAELRPALDKAREEVTDGFAADAAIWQSDAEERLKLSFARIEKRLTSGLEDLGATWRAEALKELRADLLRSLSGAVPG